MQHNPKYHYELVRRHLSLTDTTAALKELSALCQGKIENWEFERSIIYFKTFLDKQNFTIECDEIILEGVDLEIGDLKSVQNKVMAYVIYRIQYYAEKNENEMESESFQFLKSSAIVLIHRNYRDNPKYFLTLLSFLLNFSRGLIDDDTKFIDEFYGDFMKLTRILDKEPNQIIEFDSFKDVGEIPDLFRDGIKAFHESLKSPWARKGLKAYLDSVGLDYTIEEVNLTLEKMPIYIIRQEIGIKGMVCFGYIVLSINNLSKQLTGPAVIARVFVSLWHQSSYYLLRTINNDFLAITPRSNGDKDGVYSALESGYRLQRQLFGTYEYCIWLDSVFSKYVRNRKWKKLNYYQKVVFEGKTGLKVRFSYLNSSGMDMAVIKSSKDM